MQKGSKIPQLQTAVRNYKMDRTNSARSATDKQSELSTIEKTSNDIHFDSVGERVAAMRPSQELLDYYRSKVNELTTDHESLLSHLDKLTETCEQQHKMEWQLRQREDEIAELQRALSDMQIYLFQEREQVLRLYAENDRLKIRDLEDRKKIQHLLQLSGLNESEVTYFVKDPSAHLVASVAGGQTRPLSTSTNTTKLQNEGNKKTVSLLQHESTVRELESYRQQVKTLQSQLEEQIKLSKEQIEALREDRRINSEETEKQRHRDQEKIKQLSDKLKKTQDLLYDSTKDFLDQRNKFRQSEKQWITEKDRLYRRLEHAKLPWNNPVKTTMENNAHFIPSTNNYPITMVTSLASAAAGHHATNNDIHSTQNNHHGSMSARVWAEVNGQLVERREEQMRRTIKNLEEQLEQQQKLAEMYRDQVVQLEDDFARVREASDVSKEVLKERSEKITKRLQLMNHRYQELEKRRTLEIKGFQTDIANLRQKLRTIEKQLYKVTLDLSEQLSQKSPDDIDLIVLRNIKTTTNNSKKLTNELRNLKAMIYGLENEIRRT